MTKKADDSFTVRMDDLTRWKLESWYKKDGCRSRNEFVLKALNFYVDYLAGQENAVLQASQVVGVEIHRFYHELISAFAVVSFVPALNFPPGQVIQPQRKSVVCFLTHKNPSFWPKDIAPKP